MTAAMSGNLHRLDRPPESVDAAPAPDIVRSSRVTTLPRPWISPRLVPGEGFAPDHPSVRRFWIALAGPAAIADLLRLIAAARTGRCIRRPIGLPLLLRERLVRRDGDQILVPDHIPLLSPDNQRRLHPSLRAEYRRIATPPPTAR